MIKSLGEEEGGGMCVCVCVCVIKKTAGLLVKTKENCRRLHFGFPVDIISMN